MLAGFSAVHLGNRLAQGMGGPASDRFQMVHPELRGSLDWQPATRPRVSVRRRPDALCPRPRHGSPARKH